MLETDIVNETIKHVAETSDQFTPLMERGVMTYPIPFFGNLSRARVITLGLNPSNKEFIFERKWCTNMPKDAIAKKLFSYFKSTVPHHPFFTPWQEALKYIGASYESDAVHLDLSPRATYRVSHFTSKEDRLLFLEMLHKDAPIWIRAMEAIADQIEIILAAGSATKEYYINEFIKAELGEYNVHLEGDWERSKGPGQIAFHTLILPSGRKIPLFFCSTGPSNRAVLVEAIRKNAPQINSKRNSIRDYIFNIKREDEYAMSVL